MHYIDAADNIDGQFQGGNANIGLKGTVVDASWLNAVQDEICNVITKSGEQLDKDSSTQLWESIEYSLPRIKHKRIVGQISSGTVGIDGQTKIADFKELLGVTDVNALAGKFIDVNVFFGIRSATSTPNSYFAASIIITKKNGSYSNVAWYSIPSTSENKMDCRWCFLVPDGLRDDDPVSLYIYTRTEGTTVNPHIAVSYSGSYSVDPNIYII